MDAVRIPNLWTCKYWLFRHCPDTLWPDATQIPSHQTYGSLMSRCLSYYKDTWTPSIQKPRCWTPAWYCLDTDTNIWTPRHWKPGSCLEPTIQTPIHCPGILDTVQTLDTHAAVCMLDTWCAGTVTLSRHLHNQCHDTWTLSEHPDTWAMVYITEHWLDTWAPNVWIPRHWAPQLLSQD